jgi:hypothetical protein
LPEATATQAGAVKFLKSTVNIGNPDSTTNVDSFTISDSTAIYMDGFVTIRGRLTVDPTVAGSTTLNFPLSGLPYAKISGDAYSIIGRCYRNGNPTSGNTGRIYQNSAQINTAYSMQIDSVSSTGASTWIYEFTYESND